jgi:hypothetical protein
MATGDVRTVYQASANQTVTGLGSLASDTSFLAGWEGEVIDLSSTGYTDARVTLKLTAGSSPTAGEIRLYFVGMLDDSTWPDVFDGTASAETVTSIDIRDAICKWGGSTRTNTTSSRVYYIDVPSLAEVFKYNVPAKCVPFVTHSMVASTPALSAGNHQLTVKFSSLNVAA